MDFYNPILSYSFLQTEINPLQPSKMETTKPKIAQLLLYLSFFFQPTCPITFYQLYVFKNKTKQKKNQYKCVLDRNICKIPDPIPVEFWPKFP